jgi:hypothetical protein
MSERSISASRIKSHSNNHGSSSGGKLVMYQELPVSSDDLQIPIKELDSLLSVYGTLRSFSFLFRLSPFPITSLSAELNQSRMSSLIDEV